MRTTQPTRSHQPDTAPAATPALASADYFQVFLALPAPALLINPLEGEVIEANMAWLAEFNYTRAEALGRTLLDLGVYAYPNQRQEIIAALAAQDGRHQSVIEFRHRDGRVTPYLTSITSLSIAGRACWLAVAYDVTERQQAEVAMRERLKEMACLAAVRQALNGPLSLAEFCREVVRLLAPAMQFPELAVAVLDLNGERYASAPLDAVPGAGLQADITVRGQTCGRLWVGYRQARSFLLPYEQDLVDGVAQSLEQRLEHHLTLQTLQTSEARLNEAQRLTHIGSSYWDARTDTTSWSEEMYRIAGWDPALPAPTLAERATLYTPESFARINQEIERVIATGQPYDLEAEIVRPDGALRQVHLRGGPVRGPDGTVRGLNGTVEDITERKQAEAALRESEEKFKYVFDHSVVGKSITFPDGRLSVNRAYCDMLGYAPGELDNEVWQRVTHPDDLAESERQVARLLAGEAETTRFTKRYLHKSGAIVWADIGIALRRDAQGQPLYFITAVLDITERVLAETALRASEARYRQIIETTYEGVLATDLNWRVTYANDRIAAILGYAPNEIVGLSIDTFILPEDEAAFRQRQAERQEGVAGTREGAYRTKSGAPVWLLISSTPISEAGRFAGVFYMATDITDRKQAEAALRASEAKLRALFAALPVGVSVLDPERRVIESNPALARLLRLTPEGLATGAYAQRTYIHPDGRPVEPEEFPSIRAFNDQAPVLDVEIGVVTETSAVIWTSVSAAPVSAAGLGAVVVTSDITDRKQAEAARRESEERLRITFQTSPDALVIVSEADGRLVEVNDQFCRLYGYARDEVIGRTSAELGVWADFAQRAKILAQLDSHERVTDVEVLARKKSGQTFPVLYSVSRLRLANQALYLGVIHDISERKLAEQQILQLNRLYSILTRTNEVLVRARDRQELFTEVCRIATTDGWLRMAWVGLTDPASRLILPVAAAGHQAGYLDHLRITRDDEPDGRGPTGTAVREDRHVICRDISNDPVMAQWREAALARGYRASAAFPLRLDGQVIGALTVYAPAAGWFSDREVELLDELAADISYALYALEHDGQRQRAEQELRKAYDETIVGWSRALDLRDRETEGHSRRVTELTVRLAARLGLGPEELVHVRRGALLHDIGKMGVPDAILRKPGALDADELRQMQRHPQLAYDLLAPISYLQPALDIPYYHHERWDGAGYPNRLHGAAIPLAARIFAVADVWDALTSDRPYRPAWSREKTLAYIREQAGHHFDPVVVEAFLAEVAPPANAETAG